MSIGDTLRKLRMARNFSMQYVADCLNIDRRTYAAWEIGSQDIKSSFIPQLAELYGVEIADLFYDKTIGSFNRSFKNGANDTAILILTDKESINRILDAAKLG